MDSAVISTTGSVGADTGSPEGTVAPEEGQPEDGCRCDLQAGELAIQSQDREPQAREGSGQRPWGSSKDVDQNLSSSSPASRGCLFTSVPLHVAG